MMATVMAVKTCREPVQARSRNIGRDTRRFSFRRSGAILWVALIATKYRLRPGRRVFKIYGSYIVVFVLFSPAPFRTYVYGRYVLFGPTPFPHLHEMIVEAAARLGLSPIRSPSSTTRTAR